MDNNYTLTPEQDEFIQATCSHATSSLDIRAVAGSGKTTTMVEAAKAAADAGNFRNALACAFNKEIADTLGKKMPYGVECRTTHSLGLRALTASTSTRPKLNKWKSANYLQAEFGKLWTEPSFAVQRADLRQLTGLAKMNMLDPEDFDFTVVQMESLIEDRGLDIASHLTTDFSVMAAQALTKSNEDTVEIDFDDMIYLPLVQQIEFKQKYDLVFIDEAQDLAAIQHELLRNICSQRLVSVGDPNQAIYGWRGAVSNSMDELARAWGSERLKLTYSFRCGSEIVKLAQQIVPHITSPAGQHAGQVLDVDELSVADFIDHGQTAVICRNRKPLVDMAFYLFQQNIPCYVSGGDIGRNLMNLVNLLGVRSPGDVKLKLLTWKDKQVSFLQAKGRYFAAEAVKDRAETIITVAERLLHDKPSASIVDLKNFVNSIFKENGEGIPLMTIHKAKGLEFSNVIFYGPELLPSPYARTPEEYQQEENLKYVAITRAINRLVLAPQDAIHIENGRLAEDEKS